MKAKYWILLVGLVLLTGCGKKDVQPSPDDGKIKLYGLIPPIAWICEQIGGDKIVCHTLVPDSQSVHSYQPSPRDIATLQSADYYLMVGLPMEHNIICKVLTGSKVKIVDVTAGIKLRQIESSEACDCEHGHEQHQHNKDEKFHDTHVWMSPVNNIKVAQTILRLLSDIDPDNREFYQQNTERLESQINAVDQTLKTQLAPWKGKKFMVYHPAFGYFADHYEMLQTAVETGGKSPTPKQLEKLINEARAEDVKLIFVQPQYPQNSARAISTALDARIITVDPLQANVLETYRNIANHLTTRDSGE